MLENEGQCTPLQMLKLRHQKISEKLACIEWKMNTLKEGGGPHELDHHDGPHGFNHHGPHGFHYSHISDCSC